MILHLIGIGLVMIGLRFLFATDNLDAAQTSFWIAATLAAVWINRRNLAP